MAEKYPDIYGWIKEESNNLEANDPKLTKEYLYQKINKKSNNIKNHFLDIPIYRESKKDDASKQNTTVVLSDDVHDLEKLLESKVETTEKKKTKTSTKVKLKSR